MIQSRRTVMATLLGASVVIAGIVLYEVLATIFFAITIAYVLIPVSNILQRYGLSQWWASIITTILTFVAAILGVAPIGVVMYLRRREIIEFLQALPPTITIDVVGFTYALDVSEGIRVLTRFLTQFAVEVVRSAPVLGAKATVFGFVIFAVLLRHDDLKKAILAPIPRSYHHVSFVIHERIKSTLFALYVIQMTTAVGTFVIALPMFWVLGYSFPITLAVLAGILQFLPVVGPSVLVILVAAYEVSGGAYLQATLVFITGMILIAILPDILIRPRLARHTARLPGSLYLVGFIGGILSLGPIGIIAGPLAVSVLSLLLMLLATEMNATSLTDTSS